MQSIANNQGSKMLENETNNTRDICHLRKSEIILKEIPLVPSHVDTGYLHIIICSDYVHIQYHYLLRKAPRLKQS